jgi:hypothetical protein
LLIDNTIFGIFIFILAILQIMMSVVYGVGQMAQERYNVSLPIRLINLILNRFDLRMGLTIYILNAKKGTKLKYVLILLFIAFSAARLSLGNISYLFFLLILCCYNGNIFRIIYKWTLPIIILLIFTPFLVSTLYNIRSQLRGETITQSRAYSTIELIGGKLIGRLSSYSASAYVLQKASAISIVSNKLPEYQLYLEATFMNNPDNLGTGNIILESLGNHTRLYSYMNGTIGLLLASYYNSFSMFFISLSGYIVFIIFPFILASTIKGRRMQVLILLSLIQALVSGDPYALGKVSINIFFYILLFLVINFFKQFAFYRGNYVRA